MKPERATWLDEEALHDILDGACILGAGGGGPYVLGQELVKEVLKAGPPRVAEPAEIGDAATMAVSACAGSPTAAATGAFPYQVATQAFTRLEEQRGAKFEYVLPGELGAGNSFIPMLVAAQKKIPLVDAAGARRAMTTLEMATYAAARVPVSPVVVADLDTVIGFTAASAKEADPVMRAVISSGAFPNYAGIAFWTMTGQTMKQAAIPRTLTYARDLGKALREARAARKDPVEAVRAFLGGKLLFRGKLVVSPEQQTAGFDVGQTTLVSPDGRARCTVYNQNENAIAWTDQRPTPLGMGPDLLCWLTADGQPFSNATPDVQAYAKGEVALIGAPSPRASRVPAVVDAYLAILRQIGYGGPYVPIEDLP